MAKQLYYEDVEIGSELPPLVKNPTTTQLVRWAGASGDYAPIHFDKDAALAAKLPGVILHGKLKFAFLGQLVTDWIGPQGAIRLLTCNYRGLDLPGNPLTCKGKVTKKHVQEGKNLVELEIWTENSQGEKTTPGTATVVLPSRGV